MHCSETCFGSLQPWAVNIIEIISDAFMIWSGLGFKIGLSFIVEAGQALGKDSVALKFYLARLLLWVVTERELH